MDNELKNHVDAVLAHEGAEAQANAFAALPRPVRRAAYAHLPQETRVLARKAVEAKRGIQHVDGKVVFTDEALKARHANLVAKRDDIRDNRLPALDALISQVEGELQGRNITIE